MLDARPSPRLRNSGASAMQQPFSPRSAAIRFLEEKTGLVPPASEYSEIAKTDRPPTRELLYHGVSSEGNGRMKYLKERNRRDVVDRHGAPVTSTQTIGLGTHEHILNYYVPSKNCRKPIVQSTFYRTRGIATYLD
eukprot:TRINITY_DN24452_c0_g2_i1.p1 TRINITY_DN24452_c0_g2~~TRINITY_DN24452_c0_g2_i1.p1  ORF type:complete len:136 (-),score=13.99 TRINITY_DN24452_c0_g2_i1:228-635(-)